MNRWTQTRAARFLAPSSQRLPSTNFLLKKKIRNLKDTRWVSAQHHMSNDMLSCDWYNYKMAHWPQGVFTFLWKTPFEEQQKHFKYRLYLLPCFLPPLTLLWCYSFPSHMSILPHLLDFCVPADWKHPAEAQLPSFYHGATEDTGRVPAVDTVGGEGVLFQIIIMCNNIAHDLGLSFTLAYTYWKLYKL